MSPKYRKAITSMAFVILLVMPGLLAAQAPVSQSPSGTGGRSPIPPSSYSGPQPSASPTTNRPATATTGAAGQFATEAQAKSHCPDDTVVWANLSSKIYHFSSSKDYGKTKRGAYMCERETASAGVRAAKNEKHP